MPLLDYFEGKKLLDRYGIRSIGSKYVSSADDAAKFSAGKAIVLKLISSKALHKSKAGLVKVNLKGSEIESAYNELARKGKRLRPYRIIAQKMANPGVEVIIGGRTDKQFGKLILIGMGGIYVNTFKDFALRVCPITAADASEMLDQLKSKDVITYNGRNRKMLINLVLRASKLMQSSGKISEIDLNPVIVRETDYDAVDIRMLRE